MATIKIDENGKATITLNNEDTLPIKDGWMSIELEAGPNGEACVKEVRFHDGDEWWFAAYSPHLACDDDSLSRELEDGETFTGGGGIWARHGDEVFVRDAEPSVKLAG